METKKNVVLGLFDQEEQLNRCVSELRDVHFSDEAISVTKLNAEKTTPGEFFSHVKKSVILESMMIGAVIGLPLGGVLGLLFSTAQPSAFSTPLNSIIIGSIIGACLGGVSGLILGRNIREENTEAIDQDPSWGETLLSVSFENQVQGKLANEILINASLSKLRAHPQPKTINQKELNYQS